MKQIDGHYYSCAFYATQNLHLAMGVDFSRGQSAHFWKSDCFECLTPYKPAE